VKALLDLATLKFSTDRPLAPSFDWHARLVLPLAANMFFFLCKECSILASLDINQKGNKVIKINF
jgi:hypothetical protein